MRDPSLIVPVCIVSLLLILLIPLVSAENYSSVTQWGPDSYTNRNLQSPEDITMDSSGNVYVADAGISRVKQFSSTGTSLTSSAVIDWQKSLGGSNDELIYGSGFTLLPDGGYFIMAAYTLSSDGDVTGYHGGKDIWIAKLRSNRTIEWEKCLGGSGDENGSSLTLLPDGGYLISGTTTSNDGDVSGNHGGGDIWLVKISANGTIEWQKCIGGSGLEEKPSIQIFAKIAGGYIITATTTSNDGDVSGNHGGKDFWLMQFNLTSKNIEWQRCLGGSRDEIGSSSNMLVQKGDETEFMIMGITESNDGDVSGNHGGSDIWFLKMFQNRTIAWQKCLGGSGNETDPDGVKQFSSTSDGGYLLSGYTESNDGDVSGNHGGGDAWIVKLNATHGIEWQKCIGGSALDSKWVLDQMIDNRIRVRGSTFSYDGDMTQNHGNKDFWIATLFTNGTIESVTCLGGSGDETYRFIKLTQNGMDTLLFTSNSTDGDITGNHGGNDLWLVSLNPDSSINWSHCYGGTSDDWGAGYTGTTDGKFIIHGYTMSNDGDVSGNHGKKDIWIAQSYITLNNSTTPSKIGVVRNNKTWILDASGNGAYGAGDIVYNYGIVGDLYVTGDWNGGTTKIGLVRNNNTWLLDASGNGLFGPGDLQYTFGKVGDVYVTGDWNGTGTTRIGVVRSNTTWLLDASGDGKFGPGDYQYVYGRAGDVYVTGDWNNDRKTEIGVVRNNKTWILDASGNGAYGAGDIVYNYGIAGDRYVTGDWTGNGTTRIGVVRSNTTWLLDASGNGLWGPGDLQYVYGRAGDKYVTGKWP